VPQLERILRSRHRALEAISFVAWAILYFREQKRDRPWSSNFGAGYSAGQIIFFLMLNIAIEPQKWGYLWQSFLR
jgi:hypothetical protein